MNKLVTAAVVGGAALAVGVLPAASLAQAATAPTPIPVPVAPSGPVKPGAPSTPAPVQHRPGHHAPGHRTPGNHSPGGHSPGHRAPGHGAPGHQTPGHRTPTHHRTPGGHRPGQPNRPNRPNRPSQPARPGQPGHARQPGQPGNTGQPGRTRQPGQPGHGGHGRAPGSNPGSGQGSGSGTGRGPGRTTANPAPAPSPVPRILGGRPATNSPWAAQVSWDGTGFECSGSAIAPQWVLTARHCVSDNGMTVLIGSNQLGKGTKATVDRAELDPVGDLALLHLDQPVQTSYVPLADADPQVGAINEIYGFGKTSPGSGPADLLRSARVKVTAVDCVDGAQGRAICSTGITGVAFNGDSGGPEMAGGAEVGVCSTGDVRTKTQQYASVAANRDWIRQVASV